MRKSFFSKLLGLMILGVAMMPSSKVFASGFPTLDATVLTNVIEAQLNQIQSKLSMIQETMTMDNIKQILGDQFASLLELKDVKKITEALKAKERRCQKRLERLRAMQENFDKKVKRGNTWIDNKKEKIAGLFEKSQDPSKEIEKTYKKAEEIHKTSNDLHKQGQGVVQASTNIVNTALYMDWSNPQAVMTGVAAMQKETKTLSGTLSRMEKELNTLGSQVSDLDTVGTKKTLATGTKETFSAAGSVIKKGDQTKSSKKTETDDTKTEKQQDIKTDKTPEVNSKTPSAFKKTSENVTGSSMFISRYVSMGHAAAIASAGDFKTGTDNDGNFYFADGLANWCQINYDDEIDEDTFEKCFNQICGELNAAVEEDRNDAKSKYESVLAETIPSIFNKANAIKNKAGSSTVSEDIDDLSNKAGDSTRSKIAIEIENAAIDLDMARDNLQLAIGNLELSILNDKFMSYCEDHKKAESVESSWTPNSPMGTDENGLFYFSDELASWCDLDIKKGVKAEDVELCICTICEDINAEEEAERQHNLNRYAKVRGETLAGTYVNLIRFKKEVASSEIDDRIEKIKDNANDNEQTQMSGLAEMVAQENRFQQYQNLITDAYAGMTVVFDTIPVYCQAGPVGWEKLSDKDGKTAKERCQKYVRELK